MFDDFLVSLRELVKICMLFSEDCNHQGPDYHWLLGWCALLTALPDSGADVAVARLNITEQHGDHKDNLPLSLITPGTVRLSVGGHRDDLHDYPKVNGMLLLMESL